MENKTADLAILIPSARITWLPKTLRSLAFQSDRRFRVYVADDSSGEDIAGIVSEFEDSLDIRCKTFTPNLGGTSLALHIDRALDMLREETLVLVLSDDNELSKFAVGRILKTVSRHPDFDVYHLNTEIIDAKGNVVETPKGFARKERNDRLFKDLFFKGAVAPLSSFVFRRNVFTSKLLLDETLLRTDLQTIFAASAEKGIRTVSRARLRWRRHDQSMSSTPALRRKLVFSVLGFFKWSETFFGDDYPISAGERMELFAKFAARLVPESKPEDIRDLYMQFAVFNGPIRRMKGASIIKRAIRDREEYLKDNA